MGLPEYDVVAIGGGPAGILAAITVASLGHSVALVDSQPGLGGAGANTGTVPSKTLRETALALSGMRSRNLYGVDLSLRREATVADFLRHERNVRTGLNTMLLQRLTASHAVCYQGLGSFVDPHTVDIAGSDGGNLQLRGETILIATGSSPLHPASLPFGCRGIYDSDTILQLDRLPDALAVVGAGVIGSEYACTFAALGTRVHLIGGHGALLPFLDEQVSEALAAAMAKSGIEFHWDERVESCSEIAPGRMRLTLTSGKTLEVDAVLAAAGRRSNVERLNLPAAGVSANERGLISVDQFFRTGTPHIYAAGDVIGFPALASTSMQQARIAMKHALGRPISGRELKLLPAGVYTIPEVGMIGETEQDLKRRNAEYVTGIAPYNINVRGRIIGDTDGFLKLLFSRGEMKLLGAHMIGEQSTELIHLAMMAMLTGSTATIFDEACFNVPTLGELYKMASLDAVSRVTRGQGLFE